MRTRAITPERAPRRGQRGLVACWRQATLRIAGVVYLALSSNDGAKPQISLVSALTNDFQGIFVLGTY